MGYRATIFESLPFLGGMLRVGVPAYRLPYDVLDFEIGRLLNDRIDVRLDCRVGRDVTLDGLREEGYGAFFVACGAHKSERLNIEGAEPAGRPPGARLPEERRTWASRSPVGKRIAVIGGGNVAMDAARTALRLGAEKVTVVYRRSRAEMPALDEEVRLAEEEGVRVPLPGEPACACSAATDGSVEAWSACE